MSHTDVSTQNITIIIPSRFLKAIDNTLSNAPTLKTKGFESLQILADLDKPSNETTPLDELLGERIIHSTPSKATSIQRYPYLEKYN